MNIIQKLFENVKILRANFVVNTSISLAAAVLILMAVLMFASAWNDSATMDELAHIPSGYSYLKFQDMRLNPEHPPLLKDLAALPLLFLNLNFPTGAKFWMEDINGQWDAGKEFLYKSGNDADKIIFMSRLFPILLTLLLGIFVFKWAKELYDERAALLALFLYAFSPTVLAHGRYVTTDVAAAFGIFIASYYFVKWLADFSDNEKVFTPHSRNFLKQILAAGAAFGIAQSLKFSAFLLIPFFLGLAIIWAFSVSAGFRQFFKTAVRCLFYAACIFAVGYILIVWPVYQFHTWNYPVERQVADTQFTLQSFGFRPVAELTVWMADKPVLRPFAQYLLGVLMVIQRSGGGNTAYFFGEVSNIGWVSYFPAVYLLKESLPFHILTAIALIFSVWKIYKSRKEKNNESKIAGIKTCLADGRDWLAGHFAETTMLLFIAFYWFMSMRGNLNIGIRHLLPVLPLTYILVAGKISEWLKPKTNEKIGSWLFAFVVLLKNYLKRTSRSIIIGILTLWLALDIILVFPHYLSYFNELAGGTQNGYKYAVDSNYDWGQDLKRLAEYVEKRKISKIGVDYFGGGSPEYYLGEKFIPWWSARGEPPKNTWLAVSASFLQSAFGETTKGFTRKPEDSYEWLKKYEPIDRIGYSIFIFYVQ